MGTTVEVGFVLNDGSQPLFRLNDSVRGVLDNATYLLGGVSYVDITEYVNNISFKRGKNRELDRFSAGTLTVQLNNEDRTFDPSYSGSPFYGNIIPRREIRILVDSIPQFSGVIEDWNFDYDVSGKSKAVIVAADAFTLLAQQSLTAGTATVQTSGARVAAVLDMASIDWPAANRNIDAGLSTLGADVFSGNALQYLQDVEVSEQGALFIGKDGFINFQDRGVTPTSANYLETVRTNLVTNPSMESVTSGTVVMRRNLVTNPNMETNITGWAPVASGTTLTRDTTEFYTGTASLKAVCNGASASQGPYFDTTPSGLSVGQKFSVSAWIKAPIGTQLRLFAQSSGAGNIFANNYFTATGSWQYIKAEGGTVGASLNVIVGVITSSAQAVTFYVDNAMIEMGATVGDYFDGSTSAALGWTYAWSGTANASISTAASAATTVRTNRVINPSFETGVGNWVSSRCTFVRDTAKSRYGSASAKMTAIDASGQQYIIQGSTVGDRATVTGGETVNVLASVWPHSSHSSFNFQLYEYDSAGTLLTPVLSSSQIPVTQGQWNDISASLTVKANAASVRVVVIAVEIAPVGAEWWVDAIALGAGLTSYFDGSFNPADDFSYAWTGTDNASTSIQRGATPVGWSSTAPTIQSQSEKYVGSASIQTVATATGYTYFRSSVFPSTTYTASAWVKGEAGKDVVPSLVEYTSGVSYLGETNSANVTLTGSWQRISVTRTLGATAGIIDFRVRNIGAQTFYVDAAVIEASPIVQDYFDGSTDSAFYINTWTGTENNSTSIQQKFIYSFSDNGTDIPYINVGINYGTELLFNQAIISSSAGTAISDNITSENTYGITQYSASTLVSTTSQLQNISDYVVAKYGVPELRFEVIEVILNNLTPEQRANVLNLELGDIAIIAFTPNGIGSEIVQICQVISIAHNVQVASHKISFGMSWLQFSFLVMDDVEFGRLDSTYVLAF